MITDFQLVEDLLNEKYEKYNNPLFIEVDPIQIPHRFKCKEDIEIAGFISSIFAWGNRKTILNKSSEFLNYMHNSPYEFLLNHKTTDLKPFQKFRHRTFNAIDSLYFIEVLTDIYQNKGGLENVFSLGINDNDLSSENALVEFRNHFFNQENHLKRTEKHISSPKNGASCKRLNMYLRWMVRKDNKGVDFGLWSKIKPSQLVCPVDVHVKNVATKLGLLQNTGNEWSKAFNLTQYLKMFDPVDPVKYDFALFGMGIENYFGDK